MVRLQPEILGPVDDISSSLEISRPEAVRLLINRGLAFNELSEAIETITHIGGEFLRGVPISNSDQLAFSTAIIKLFETKDDADDDLRASLEEIRNSLADRGYLKGDE